MNSQTASICWVRTMPFSRNSFSIWARLFSDVQARLATSDTAISTMIRPANFVFSFMFPMTLPLPRRSRLPYPAASSSSSTSASRAHTRAASSANRG